MPAGISTAMKARSIMRQAPSLWLYSGNDNMLTWSGLQWFSAQQTLVDSLK
jgi:hypothetical protein